MSELTFTVFGVPAPAGSKKGFYNPKANRVIITDDSKRSRPWKAQVSDAAAGAMGERGLLDGALLLEVAFFRPRPKGHYKASGGLSAVGRRQPYPVSKPDLTKLVRALEDALRSIVWRDDALVVVQRTMKVWGEPARATVTVREIEGA